MKNNNRRVFIKPDEGVHFQEQLISCFEQIPEYRNSDHAGSIVLHCSFFVNAKNNKDFIGMRSEISACMDGKFESVPTYSVIAQPPADNLLISIEITLLENKSEDLSIEFKRLHEIPYTIIESSQGKEVYAGGISAKTPGLSLSMQVEESYKLMKDILDAESLSFSDIVRQWNYVENIVHINQSDNKPVQNYQLLNDTRSVYYSQSDFKNGYPAATGIGMNYGGILLEFYAIKPTKSIDIIPVKNPKQTDAYNYPQEVLIGNSSREKTGKNTPKFERAKYISLNGHKLIFISGTASILHEKTIGVNDVTKQTMVTIDNISELVAEKNLKHSGVRDISGTMNYTFLRIYVKDASDLASVKDICDRKFKDIPKSYLIADICRDDLLVEIEGVAELV